jgi:hypothetical protein
MSGADCALFNFDEVMALTLRLCERHEDEPLCCFSDSSHGNAPEGRNYAGFVIMSKGGGCSVVVHNGASSVGRQPGGC